LSRAPQLVTNSSKRRDAEYFVGRLSQKSRNFYSHRKLTGGQKSEINEMSALKLLIGNAFIGGIAPTAATG